MMRGEALSYSCLFIFVFEASLTPITTPYAASAHLLLGQQGSHLLVRCSAALQAGPLQLQVKRLHSRQQRKQMRPTAPQPLRSWT